MGTMRYQWHRVIRLSDCTVFDKMDTDKFFFYLSGMDTDKDCFSLSKLVKVRVKPISYPLSDRVIIKKNYIYYIY